MTVAIVAFCGLAAIRTGEAAFLDVALVLALLAAIGGIAFATRAWRAGRDDAD